MNPPINNAFPLAGIDDPDAEIERLKKELHRAQKMRQLLGLRYALAEEQGLLAELQKRPEIASSMPPTNVTAEPQPDSDAVMDDSEDSGSDSTDESEDSGSSTPKSDASGEDREESSDEKDSDDDPSWPSEDDTESSVGTETDYETEAQEELESKDTSQPLVPARLPPLGSFTPTTRPAFRVFKRQLGNYFANTASVQAERSIVWQIERCLNPAILGEWKRNPWGTTWNALHHFLLTKLPGGFKNPNSDGSLYNDAKQLETQSVSSFIEYMEDLEVEYKPFLSDSERSFRLWQAVIPPLQVRCHLRPYEATYEQLAAALIETEAKCPSSSQMAEAAKAVLDQYFASDDSTSTMDGDSE